MRWPSGSPVVFVAALSAATGGGCHDERSSAYFGTTSRGGRSESSFYINGVGEPENLDPSKSTDTVSATLIHQMFEGLTVYGPKDLRPVQGVARSWDRSDDGLRLRFHLRPEARWSDGRPVTANDFAYAWRRALRPETASRAASNLYPLKNAALFHSGRIRDESAIGVRAKDDLTLEVELERPTPYFLDLTARPAFAPLREDVIEAFARRGAEDRWVRPESIVVNGPYTLDTWVFRYEITMKQNPYYWAKDTLRIEKIIWLELDSSHTAMKLYNTGEIDSLGGLASVPPEYGPLLASKQDYRRFPLLFVYWYEFNTRARPTSDPRVRQALNLAVDKRLLVEKVVPGGHLAATHYVPEITGSGYAEQIAANRRALVDPFAELEMNATRARALLEEAGYPVARDGSGYRADRFPPLEILYNSEDDAHRKIATAIQSMWRDQLGISATLRSEEWKVMIANVRDGRFQVARSGWIADYNHPRTFLETFLSGSAQSNSGWSDAAFDALMTQAEAAPDLEEGIRLYRKAEERALAGMSRMPLFFPAGATLVKPWVKGFSGNGRSLDLVRWLWIDPEWREHLDEAPALSPPELPAPGRIEAR